MTRGNRSRPARGLAAVLDYAGASHRRACGLLVVFSLIAFLPGFFQIPPVDRDEARFAQATKQMLESGQYVDIRFQDEVRYKKPVGIYWLQAIGGESGRGGRHPAGAHHHLALPAAVAVRRHRRGAADLLDRARLRRAPHRAAGGADDGKLRPARRRGAAGQDRRHAAVHLRRGDGRDGAHLSDEPAHAGASPSAGGCRRSCGPRWRPAC